MLTHRAFKPMRIWVRVCARVYVGGGAVCALQVDRVMDQMMNEGRMDMDGLGAQAAASQFPSAPWGVCRAEVCLGLILGPWTLPLPR